jgi:hypothetical protein
MKFTVVIPVYNRKKIIESALDSVFAQTFDDYEVVVVNDGSTDNTGKVVEAYPEPVRLILQNNAGPGPARNAGIEAAEGEYVAFLDSDDRWFPWTLSTYARVIEQCDGPSLVSGSVVTFRSGSSLPEEADLDSLRLDEYGDFLEAAGEGRYVSTDRIIAKKSALIESGGFTAKNINAEDHDLAFRLGDQPGYVHVEKPELVAVRRHGGQVTQDLEKTWAGLNYLLTQERAGTYPGGEGRRKNRRFLLCQHVRSASVELAKSGNTQKAFDLYRRSLPWQLRFGRLKYALGFPLLAKWPGLAGKMGLFG